ncbi:hypothetical protein M1O52_04540, partial [Dehalococcoidia bacterium]|nr:hypothetical protein [Dehalococcoidia bacterium]
RSLLLSNVGRWGLSWIKDILVRLDGSHATFPVFTEIPIIFAPPQQAATLLDMASIYHEIGHNVFQHFKEIGDELSKAISEYFSRLKKEVGPMSPMKQAEYEKNIEDAANYWAIERLSEIFSDIYATYICGPAYYFSCVDMAMKMGGNPFDVNMADVHPPASARVNACYKTLLSEHQIGDTTTLVQNMQNIWNNYINTYQRTSHFELRCGDTIIDLLVKKSIQEIQHLLPNAYHYLEKINLLQSKMITSSDSLEIILNKALEIFLKEPQYYPEWEKSAFRVLHVQNDERTR